MIKESIILAIAIIIPGGLLVYFAWKAYNRKKKKEKPSPEEAAEAFRIMYPRINYRDKIK